MATGTNLIIRPRSDLKTKLPEIFELIQKNDLLRSLLVKKKVVDLFSYKTAREQKDRFREGAVQFIKRQKGP